jgi:hypothetical protein
MDMQTIFMNGKSMTIQFDFFKLLKQEISSSLIEKISKNNYRNLCER